MNAQPVTSEDLYLYAMLLLEPADHARLQEFLQHSPEARMELERIYGDLTLLALSTEPQAIPSMSRQRLMKEVAREKRTPRAERKPASNTESFTPERSQNSAKPDTERSQDAAKVDIEGKTDGAKKAEIPAEPEAASQSTSQPRRVAASEADALLGEDSYRPSAEAVPAPGRKLPDPTDSPSETHEPRFALRTIEEEERGSRTALFFAAAAGWIVAAGLGVGAFLLLQNNDATHQQLTAANARAQRAIQDAEEPERIADLLNSEEAQHFALTRQNAQPASSGRVTYLPAAGSLLFQGSRLESLPIGRVYELWLIPQGIGRTPIPAGTFRPDAHGFATMLLPTIPKGIPASSFGVTQEDEGGADKPTLPILMIGS